MKWDGTAAEKSSITCFKETINYNLLYIRHSNLLQQLNGEVKIILFLTFCIFHNFNFNKTSNIYYKASKSISGMSSCNSIGTGEGTALLSSSSCPAVLSYCRCR